MPARVEVCIVPKKLLEALIAFVSVECSVSFEFILQNSILFKENVEWKLNDFIYHCNYVQVLNREN